MIDLNDNLIIPLVDICCPQVFCQTKVLFSFQLHLVDTHFNQEICEIMHFSGKNEYITSVVDKEIKLLLDKEFESN